MKAYRNFSQIITLAGAHEKDGRKLKPEDLSLIKNGSVIFDENEIIWVGEDKDYPQDLLNIEIHDYTGKVLVPEIVDCHTHLVFGGDRSSEYSMRLNGADYQAIAKAGGGILSTMNATNELSQNELFELACKRVEQLHSYGIGTIEIKSGYGLNIKKERELTYIIDDLKKKYHPEIRIVNTFMAAHAIHPDFETSSDYMDQVVLPLLEELAAQDIIDCVDIFFETGYFTKEDTIKLYKAATELNIPVKGHMDEFGDNKGAVLGVKYKALSVDHLLNTTKDGINALAKSDTVATLLPGTGFFLGVPQADARALLDKGAKVAIGSDYNPGSCHCDNLLMIASLAAPAYKMNMCELWSAITLNASHALNITDQGAVKEGLKPRFTIFNTDSIDKVTYHWGRNLI